MKKALLLSLILTGCAGELDEFSSAAPDSEAESDDVHGILQALLPGIGSTYTLKPNVPGEAHGNLVISQLVFQGDQSRPAGNVVGFTNLSKQGEIIMIEVHATVVCQSPTNTRNLFTKTAVSPWVSNEGAASFAVTVSCPLGWTAVFGGNSTFRVVQLVGAIS